MSFLRYQQSDSLRADIVVDGRKAFAAGLLVIASLLNGCGGSAESPQAAPTNVAKPQPFALPSRAAPTKGIQSGISPRDAEAERKAREAREMEEFLQATTKPDDFFRVSNDLPNHLVTGRAPAYAPEELALITAVPLDVEGASAFVVEAAGAGTALDSPGTVKLPEGFVPVPKFGTNAKGEYLRIWCENDNSLMALVSEGTFLLGHNGGPTNVQPENTVDLDSFYIDVYEVSVEQFQTYINDIRGEKRGSIPQPYNISGKKDEPIRGLNWGEARGYARWAGKDLPTEAEWGKGARGPRGYRHPWGEGRAIWTREREVSQIDPIGSFQHDVSYYGAFDMAGNVREWCLDHYTDDAYQDLAQAVPKVRLNWSGPRRSSPSNHRVVRGNGPDWELWHRWPVETGSRPEDVGFRGVLRLKAME